MTIAHTIKEGMEQSSWIRKMFEEGGALKKHYGAENVFDFSLGNPDLEPPALFTETLKKTVSKQGTGHHAYMPNAGYPETRKAIADTVSQEHQVEITHDQVVMTCGAGGALNVVLKTLLNPDEEVIIPVPYFAEYLFYVGNHGGCCRLVTTGDDFSLDLAGIERSLSSKTKARLSLQRGENDARVQRDVAI